MSPPNTDPAFIGMSQGDAAQMEQIRQSLVHVATEAADKAAQRTVERLFVGLGIDVSKPDGIIRLHDVLKFGGDLLDARDTIRRVGLRTTVGVITTAFFGLVLLGFRGWIRLP